MMSNDLVLPKLRSKFSEAIWATIGFVFFIPIMFFYTQFFERDTYIRRKALLKWLKKNKLPDPEILEGYCSWSLGNYRITLIEKTNTVYIGGSEKIQLSSWNNGFIDKYRYNRILKILKREKASYVK